MSYLTLFDVSTADTNQCEPQKIQKNKHVFILVLTVETNHDNIPLYLRIEIAARGNILYFLKFERKNPYLREKMPEHKYHCLVVDTTAFINNVSLQVIHRHFNF